MRDEPCRGRRERGSALVLALLVAFILSLLAISFLMVAETESQIALNERRGAQVLAAAETGARLVKRWFDRPETFLGFPDLAVAVRNRRVVLDESDPYGSPGTQADGATLPYWKGGVDLDGNGADDLFRRPYRGGVEHALMGTEDGPDLRIDDESDAGRAFLDELSVTLFGEEAGEPNGVRLRLARIDVAAPPYLRFGTGWARYGLATVKVVARVYQGERVLAERAVRATLAEAPYAGPYGALHSCADLALDGAEVTAHWGVVTAENEVRYPDDPSAFPLGLPRALPGIARVDRLWPEDQAGFDTLRGRLESGGPVIEDPWFRSVSGGPVNGTPSAVKQTWPPAMPSDPPASPCCDHSQVFQNLPLAPCPQYDYELWKTVASSGESDVRYFAHAGGSSFREQGTGPALGFAEITRSAGGGEALWFFDTADGRPPRDLDGDGRFDNLTPGIAVGGEGWSPRGMIFLNAERLHVDGVNGAPADFRAPGEPFRDTDQDGMWEEGESWIDLDYPPSLSGLIRGGGGNPGRDARGPVVPAEADFHGILYTTGQFVASGEATFYGTVIARSGVVQEDTGGAGATPDLYWDASIPDEWPPEGWSLPRVIVTGWEAP